MFRTRYGLILCAAIGACAEDQEPAPPDGGALPGPDASDAGDSGPAPGPRDAGATDGGPTDATSPIAYHCGAFSEAPTWTVQAGFRAVVVADEAQGLSEPVAITFAGAPFGDRLIVVNQGNDTLSAIDVLTGTSTVFVPAAGWPVAPALLTTITWDEDQLFDGALYVGDQGGDGDGDSRIFRVGARGAAQPFAAGPGPGLDDIYALVFVPGPEYAPGLYVAGDTDGAGDQWGRYDATGQGTTFSAVSGIEGAVYDHARTYGGGLITARPLGGGYTGNGTLTPILPGGTAGATLAADLGGIHAPVISPGGTFGPSLYAASWSDGRLLRLSTAGEIEEVASGLSLTNYDGNILAFSPDGNVLYVADRLANRIVCIEPIDE